MWRRQVFSRRKSVQSSLIDFLFWLLLTNAARGEDIKTEMLDCAKFHKITLEGPPGAKCEDGVIKTAMGLVIITPGGDNVLKGTTNTLIVNCHGSNFQRFATLCPCSGSYTSRTVKIKAFGVTGITAKIEGKVNEWSETATEDEPSQIFEITHHPSLFAGDYKLDIKSLSRAPDDIFVINLDATLTKERLLNSQAEIVVEDESFTKQKLKGGVKKDDVPEAVMQINPSSCPGFFSRGSSESQIHLTFRFQGRIAFSHITKPKLAKGKWYVGIWLFQQNGSTYSEVKKPTTKRVKFYLRYRDISLKAQAWPMVWLLLVSFGGGIIILIYFHFLIQQRFKFGKRQLVIWLQLMFVYVWQGKKDYSQLTLFVGVVFGSAALQAVLYIFEHSLRTGDRDLCTYNERCNWIFFHQFDVSWNSLYSNLVYMIHGLMIILSFSLKEASCYSQRHYYYYDYSVSYAIGWALFFVGLFSGFYHICPGRVVFQMDTTFMFTLSVFLCVAVVHGKSIRPEDLILESHGYHMESRRRSSIRAGEVFLFFLAPLIFFNYIGAMKDEVPPRSGGYDPVANDLKKRAYGLTKQSEIFFIVTFYIWLIFILCAGALKTGIFVFRRVKQEGEDALPPTDKENVDRDGGDVEESSRFSFSTNAIKEKAAEENDDSTKNHSKRTAAKRRTSQAPHETFRLSEITANKTRNNYEGNEPKNAPNNNGKKISLNREAEIPHKDEVRKSRNKGEPNVSKNNDGARNSKINHLSGIVENDWEEGEEEAAVTTEEEEEAHVTAVGPRPSKTILNQSDGNRLSLSPPHPRHVFGSSSPSSWAKKPRSEVLANLRKRVTLASTSRRRATSLMLPSLNYNYNKSTSQSTLDDAKKIRMQAQASLDVIMAENPGLTHGKRTVSTCQLWVLRVLYICYSILMIAYFGLAFATPNDMSVTFLNFTLSIGGMSLIVGEVFQFSHVEVRRQDRRKCAIIAALVCWYLAIVTFAVPALYYFTFQQVYLAGLDVADSRDINRECMLLDYYDTHSLWHILGSFMLLLTALRVGMLSEPCRMCSMRMVGEASATPSIAFEDSQFNINVDGEGKEVEGEAERRKRREKVAEYEIETLRRRDTIGAKAVNQFRDNKLPDEMIEHLYSKPEKKPPYV